MSESQEYHLEVPMEFDFQQNLNYLLRESNEVMYQIEGQKITRVVEIDNLLILIRLSYKETYLRISILNEVHLSEEQVAKLLIFVEDFF